MFIQSISFWNICFILILLNPIESRPILCVLAKEIDRCTSVTSFMVILARISNLRSFYFFAAILLKIHIWSQFWWHFMISAFSWILVTPLWSSLVIFLLLKDNGRAYWCSHACGHKYIYLHIFTTSCIFITFRKSLIHFIGDFPTQKHPTRLCIG